MHLLDSTIEQEFNEAILALFAFYYKSATTPHARLSTFTLTKQEIRNFVESYLKEQVLNSCYEYLHLKTPSFLPQSNSLAPFVRTMNSCIVLRLLISSFSLYKYTANVEIEYLALIIVVLSQAKVRVEFDTDDAVEKLIRFKVADELPDGRIQLSPNMSHSVQRSYDNNHEQGSEYGND